MSGHYGYRVDNYLLCSAYGVLSGVRESLQEGDLRVPLVTSCIELLNTCIARMSDWDDEPYQGDDLVYRWDKDNGTALVRWLTWVEHLENGIIGW